jgi:hypothetical protein
MDEEGVDGGYVWSGGGNDCVECLKVKFGSLGFRKLEASAMSFGEIVIGMNEEESGLRDT